jgi:hypothetical protein
MREKSPGYRDWKKRRDRKKAIVEEARKQRRLRLHFSRLINNSNTNFYAAEAKNDKPVIVSFTAPEDFRIAENSNGCVNFFNDIFTAKVKHGEKGVVFYVNLKNVKYISVDSLMFLLSIAQDEKYTQKNIISFKGSFPADEKCRAIVEKSGFLNYVFSKAFVHKFENSEIGTNTSIMTGKKVEPRIIKNICDFVKNDFPNSTQRLYKVVGEMMSNTNDHAYPQNESISSYINWLVYVEHKENKMELIFLDNGVGIASSVFKKFSEKLANSVSLQNDTELVLSALRGDEMRSDTGLPYRGRGLPRILGSVNEKYFSKIQLITNKAFITIENGQINSEKLQNNFMGTMFYIEKNIL